MTITPQRAQKMGEIGDGNLNWPRIVSVPLRRRHLAHSGTRQRRYGRLRQLAEKLDNMREKMGL